MNRSPVRAGVGAWRPSRRVGWAIGATAVVVVGWAVARQGVADWREVARQPFHLDVRFLLVSWLVQTAGWLLVVELWRRIVVGVGGPEIPYRRHLVAHTWSGLGNIVPGSIWLPASRVALYRRYGVPAFAVSAAVIVEWLVIGVAGLALYAASVPFVVAVPRAAVVGLVLAAVVSVGVLHPRVFRAGLRFATERMRGPDSAPTPEIGRRAPTATQTATWILGETLVLALAGFGFFFFMRAVAPASSVPYALTAWALSVAVANLLAWMPATVLFKDGAMAVALLPLYGSLPVAIAVVLAWRLWMTVVLLSWAVIASATAAITNPPSGHRSTDQEPTSLPNAGPHPKE